MLAAHSRRLLGSVAIGTALAAVSTIAALLGAVTFPSLIGDAGRLEARVAVSSALVMLIICGYQTVAWYLAWREWSGERDSDLRAFGVVSFVAHLVSYVVVLVGMWNMLSAMVIAGV